MMAQTFPHHDRASGPLRSITGRAAAHYDPLILLLIVTLAPRSAGVIIRPHIDPEFAAASTRRSQEGRVVDKPSAGSIPKKGK
jgi:hypothetical protein